MILIIQLVATNLASSLVANFGMNYSKPGEIISPLDQSSYFEQRLASSQYISPRNRPWLQTRSDDDSAGVLDELLTKYIPPPQNVSFPKDIAQIVHCMRCVTPIMLAARAAFVSGNGFERFVNICHRMNNVFECTKHLRRNCTGTIEFEDILNGFKYLCSEQYSAYKNIAECLDVQSMEVAKKCEDECHTTKSFVGWFFYGFMRSTMPMTIQEGDIPPKVNVLYFRKLSSESCTLLHCYLVCIRDKYNAKCGGVGGSMALEAFLRPFASLYKSWSLNPIINTFRLILPAQCNFVTEDDGLKVYRLTEKQSEQIKKSFSHHYPLPLSVGTNGVPGSAMPRTAPELRAKLTSLLSHNRQHSESDDSARFPARTTSEPGENELLLGELEARIMELKRTDERQRAHLAAHNNWHAK